MRLMVKSESIATPRVELTELVRMAQQEDRSAFEEIVRRTTGLARKTAFGVVRPHQVDDVVQEAFLTVYQKLHHLRDPAAFQAWLARIVLHACYAFRKKSPLRQMSTRSCFNISSQISMLNVDNISAFQQFNISSLKAPNHFHSQTPHLT